MKPYFDDWVLVEDDLPQVDKKAKNRSVVVNVMLMDGSTGVGYVQEDTRKWSVKRIKNFRIVRDENPVAAWQSIGATA